ncbi:MAG: class I SAM-dependent methyltransferase [bacterium]|nr:class I SAM-dependent methyltransferase [bacterium]
MKTIVENPSLYDLLYLDIREDIEMYRGILKESANILEFGAGTGRITIPLAKDGHNICAVDLSKEMLTGLKEKISSDPLLFKNIKPVLANMCSYQSNIKYDAVIIPLTSFNYLLTKEEQLACLKSVRQALSSSGFAIIELLSKKTFLDTNQSSDFTFVKRISVDNNSYYDYYRITKLDFNSRTITQNRLFKYYKNNQYISSEEYLWNNRFVTVEDFTLLANEVGLEIDEVYGNCQLEKYNDESEDVFVKVRGKNNE